MGKLAVGIRGAAQHTLTLSGVVQLRATGAVMAQLAFRLQTRSRRCSSRLLITLLGKQFWRCSCTPKARAMMAHLLCGFPRNFLAGLGAVASPRSLDDSCCSRNFQIIHGPLAKPVFGCSGCFRVDFEVLPIMVQEHLPTTARRMVLHLWDVAQDHGHPVVDTLEQGRLQFIAFTRAQHVHKPVPGQRHRAVPHAGRAAGSTLANLRHRLTARRR
mmetsp:Transcript_65603/g.213627  ORF Transcript_65603/g.213627 Transcript_65603/m.213627 type:complete len:215 (-) Transcript_65603:1780-2424(-)